MTTTSYTPAEELLYELDTLDIRLSVVEDKLRVDAPKDTLTPQLRERLLACKPVLLALLATPADASSVCSRCPAEVEMYSAEGVPFCQQHWQEQHRMTVGASFMTPCAQLDGQAGVMNDAPTAASSQRCDKQTDEEPVRVSTTETFLDEVEALTAEVEREASGLTATESVLLALDLETTGLNPREERIVAITLGRPDHVTILDMRPYDDLPAAEQAYWHTALATLLQQPRLHVVGHNLKFDWVFLAVHMGVRLERVIDTMLAEQLLRGVGLHDGQVSVSLQATAARYGLPVKKEPRSWFINLHTRQAWHDPFPPEQVAYMVQDVEIAYRLALQQQVLLHQQGMQAVAQLEYETLPALAAMEVHGVLIDRASWQARLTEQQQHLRTEEQDILHEMKILLDAKQGPALQQQEQAYQTYLTARTAEEQRLARAYAANPGKQTWEQYRAAGLSTWGRAHPEPAKPVRLAGTLSLSSPTRLKAALNALNIPVQRTDAAALEPYAVRSPLVARLLAWKKLQKLCSAFGENVLALIAADGRLHADFAQIGASSGRIICRAPNLQQMPAHDATAAYIRRCFIAPPNHVLVKADLSNIELRILAEMSQDTTMLRLFREGKDLHAETAILLFGLAPDTNTRTHLYKGQVSVRDVAKTINFGLVYGMGAQGLAARIESDVQTAHTLIQTYFRTYPAIATWLRTSAQQALRQGYSCTLAGRKRFYPRGQLDKTTRAALERQAKNHPIQGTNADILKRAMALLFQLLPPSVHLILVVHDEIVLECPTSLVAEVTPLLQSCLLRACRDYLHVVSIPEPEVVVAPYWKKE